MHFSEPSSNPERYAADNLLRLSCAESSSLKIDRDAYPTTRSAKQEIDKARLLKTDCAEQALGVRDGKELDLLLLEKSMNRIIDSTIANQQTHIWLLNTDPTDRTDTDYCVRAAIWALVLARQVGLPTREMKILCTLTLLADIGMQLLPERIVNKRGPFRKKEFLAYRKHIDFGVELISHYTDLDDRVTGIIHCHHERQDGRGIPNKLRGKQIPLLARFANLAYCLERLLASNGEGPATPPSNALTKLYKQRALKFPEQLIVELIHVMGTYPIGSLITLSTGEVGLVLEQNLPLKIAVLTDEGKALLDDPDLVDLANQRKSKVDRFIESSYRSQNSSKCLGDGRDLDPRNYSLSFFGKRIGIGSFTVRF
jgi:hypothetical protein